MIKNITDPKVIRIINGGGICQCCTSDVMFSFDRYEKPFDAKNESECKETCCGSPGSLPRLMVESYDYDGKPGICGDTSSALHKSALEIMGSWSFIHNAAIKGK